MGDLQGLSGEKTLRGSERDEVWFGVGVGGKLKRFFILLSFGIRYRFRILWRPSGNLPKINSCKLH